MWVLNVGDIKPAEYQIELFLDMAWNIGAVKAQGVKAHYRNFLEREFGQSVARRIQPLMQEHFRLSFIRKPEFMGHTRTEERDPAYKVVSDLPWSEAGIRERMDAYRQLSDAVEACAADIPAYRQEAYFQLVKYPVQAAAQMNRKMLAAQLARHGKADWSESGQAYDSIVALTRQYNTPKWKGIMDFQPRRLPVFQPVDKRVTKGDLPERKLPAYLWKGTDCVEGTPVVYEGLGYSEQAVGVPEGEELVFEFDDWASDSLRVEVCMLPVHPVDGHHLRFTLELDGELSEPISYETRGRSEEWKRNVLSNRAIRHKSFVVKPRKKHRLVFRSIDEGVVLDQLSLYDF